MLNVSLLDKCSKLFCGPFEIRPAELQLFARGEARARTFLDNLPAV